MTFKFYNEKNEVVEIDVDRMLKLYPKEGSFLHNLLKAEKQPVSYENALKIYKVCKNHDQEAHHTQCKTTKHTLPNSTLETFKRIKKLPSTAGVNFLAMHQVMDQLNKGPDVNRIQSELNAYLDELDDMLVSLNTALKDEALNPEYETFSGAIRSQLHRCCK